jgi:hypothetical protein
VVTYFLADSNINRGDCSAVKSAALINYGRLVVNPGTDVCSGGDYRKNFTITSTVGAVEAFNISAEVGLGPPWTGVRSFTCGSMTIETTYHRAWFQTVEGDVHAGGRISSKISGECTGACQPFFSKAASAQSSPGVISYAGGFAPEFGMGEVSEPGWLAETSLPRKGFDYFNQILGTSPGEPINDLNDIQPDIPVYHAAGNLTVESDFTLGDNRRAIVFVDGDLQINANITVPKGGTRFLMFVVRNDINIGELVTDVQGIYFADGTLTVKSDGADDEDISTADSQFRGEGGFVGGQVVLERNLLVGNTDNPAELFTFRPDLWLNAPTRVMYAPHTWEEMAP